MAKRNSDKEQAPDDERDLKLKLIMDADPAMEDKYRQEYLQFKHDEEFFRNRIEMIHERYENVMFDIRR